MSSFKVSLDSLTEAAYYATFSRTPCRGQPRPASGIRCVPNTVSASRHLVILVNQAAEPVPPQNRILVPAAGKSKRLAGGFWFSATPRGRDFLS